ncbi:MAG: hypothetical protein WDW38_008813 [Sanguina aurantia]
MHPQVNDITRIVEADRKRIALTQASALSEQQKMELLLQQAAATSQSLEELSTQIEALEQQRGTVRFEHQQLADRISTSADKIQEAIGEGARAKESLKMGERNLLDARRSVDSARLLLNPLNHPRIKSLVYGSKS